VNGVVTISHGSASTRAICNAVQHTVEAVDHHINEHIIDAVSVANTRLAAPVTESATAQA
jgi:fatty acid/phospholipid biosynthesis enzyme